MDIGTQIALFIFAAIFAAVVMIPIIIVFLMPFGGLLAPFAALICYVRARSVGLSSGHYARMGALYSTILFLPWIYLIVRMFNKNVPNILIGIGYFVLYTMWLFGSILVMSVMTFIVGGATFSFDSEVEYRYVYALVFCIFLVLLSVNVVMWVLSMVRLDRFHKNHTPREEILPDRAYIMPFAYALVWIAATGILFVAGIALINLVYAPE